MAEIEFENSSRDCNAMDYPAHKQTYETFIFLTKWALIILVALLAFMALTLV